MLKLRQLEIQGFKSFVDKTKIELKEDLLIVVGPNGSGKSNVADCILWAIGEQSAKSLRGATMQDVIFKGTKKRPAAGSAEVFLLFEKEDGQKVRVGRRLSRNGDSSYMIDDNNVRLKDIHEFCYRNNISVHGSYLVEQGRVEKMLALSPQERKSLFEEVAGIAHYKESRKASESKLNSTKQDLLRVNDIIVEIEAEQAELKKQAAKAERYTSLQKELNVKKRAFFGRNLQELKARKRLLEEELRLFFDDREKRSANLATLESGLEASRLKKADEESAFDSLTGAIHELELAKQKKEQENKGRVNQIVDARARISQIDEYHVTLAQREKDGRKEISALDARKEESARQKEEIDDRLGKASVHLDGLKNKLVSVLGEIEAKRKASFELGQEKTGKSTTLHQIEDGLRKLEEADARRTRELERLASQREKAEEAMMDEEASLLQTTNRLAEKESELGKVRAELEGIRKSISSLTRDISAAEKNAASSESRIRVLREQESVQKSKARDLLEKLDSSLGDRKLARELGKLPKETLKALELVMGEGLLAYRTSSSRKALDLIDSVKEDVKERFAFLTEEIGASHGQPPRDMGKYRSFKGFVHEMEGIPDWLKPHVRMTARFSERDEAVAFTQKTGLSSIIGDSAIVNPEGIIYGGPARELAIPLVRLSKEIEDARKELESERTKLSSLKESLASERKREDSVSSSENSLASARSVLQEEVQKALLSKQKVEGELSKIASFEDLQRGEEASIREQREDFVSEKARIEGRLKHLEKEFAETNGSLSLLGKEEAGLRQEIAASEEALTGKRIEETQWAERNKALEDKLKDLGRHLEEVVTLMKRHEDEKEQKLAMIKKLESDILEEEKSLARTLTEMAASREKLQNYGDTIRCLEEELMRSEKLVKEARETAAEVQAAISEREKELAEVNSDHKNLIERFSSSFEEECDAIAAEWEGSPRMEPQEREAGLAQVTKLEKRINEMGPQNLLAKEDYEKVSKRGDFLKEQRKDVESAVAQLEETIRKTNEAIKSRYIEAYEEVNRNFTELFKTVFDGGQAYLKLEDPDNPLESGIEVVAQPPGSVVQLNLLLSGGQKALVALTLLFAILSYKPQPFFLLDEVDAPLDDANIEKVLSKLLLQFSQKTQFIVISHNKRTMALGDAIYGVTMEEPCISKIISVNLREVSAQG